jgi:DNA-binding response OmpR family regulator
VADKKVVVMSMPQEDEQAAIYDLLQGMDLTVHRTNSGRDTIFMLEDQSPDLLILDQNLTDMHAFKLLMELKERVRISKLPILVIADNHKMMPLENIATLVRPVGIRQLEKTIMSLLKSRNDKPIDS